LEPKQYIYVFILKEIEESAVNTSVEEAAPAKEEEDKEKKEQEDEVIKQIICFLDGYRYTSKIFLKKCPKCLLILTRYFVTIGGRKTYSAGLYFSASL
jgi:hypothetical protein